VGGAGGTSARTRVRREPPAFRRVTVRGLEPLTPRLVRVTLTGPDLRGLTIDSPAASVRLLLPSPGGANLVVPTWNGNEFLLPDGRRPTIRTFTPRRVDEEALELELQIVVHDGGAASDWVDGATPGDEAAVSGPGRGYVVDDDAPAFLLAGDETAIPAISQLLEELPADRPVEVVVEVARPEARLPLPPHPAATVRWCDLPPSAAPGDAIVAAVREGQLAPEARVWAAGEAAGVQRLRRHLFEERQVPRRHASVRGYWKRGRSGGDDDDGA
jgi:NADPH-dependent ferric siderophore reductase